MLKRLSVATLAALAVACESYPRPVLKVGTNGTSFQREAVPSTPTSPVATIPYNTWNRGDATAFLPACGAHPSAVVERFVGGSWESYASSFCLDFTLQTPIALRAGESRQDEVAIGDAGHFRIRMPFSANASTGDGFNAISADFDVH